MYQQLCRFLYICMVQNLQIIISGECHSQTSNLFLICRPLCRYCLRQSVNDVNHKQKLLTLAQQRAMYTFHHTRHKLLVAPPKTFPVCLNTVPVRYFMVGRLLKTAGRLIKLRYLVLTTAVGGGISLQKVN